MKFLPAVLMVVAACGEHSQVVDPPGEETAPEARLSIVGDDDVFGADGDVNALVVRYHDSNDEPLAGVVYFSLVGDQGDSELSRQSAATDIYGMAVVDLTLAGDVDASFEVKAEAADATPVRWRVAYTATPADPSGDYDVTSDLRLPDEPPLLGLAILSDAVDGPFDPATWLLDGMESSLEPPLAGLLSVARAGGALDATLNDLLAFDSPAFYSRMFALDQKVRKLSRELTLESTLRIDGAHAVHSVKGGDEAEADVQLQSSSTLIIGSHSLTLPFGDDLSDAVDDVAVPSVDAWAADLAGLLNRAVDCAAFGDEVADRVGVGPSELYEVACVNALLDRAAAVHYYLRDVDATLTLTGVLERFTDGVWNGTLEFPSETIELEDQEFRVSQ